MGLVQTVKNIQVFSEHHLVKTVVENHVIRVDYALWFQDKDPPINIRHKYQPVIKKRINIPGSGET